MTTQSKRDELAEALTRDPRDGSWVMNPKGAFLKGYDEGFDAAIEEVLQTMNEMLAPTSPTMFELRTKIKSPRERV